MRKILFCIYTICSCQISHAQSVTSGNNSFSDYIGGYQKYISPIKGSECPMYPSCSNYGLMAFKTQKPIKAFSSTADRLLRCGHEQGLYNLTLQDNGFRLIDFPDNSEYDRNIIYSKNKSFWTFSDTLYPKEPPLMFVKYLINKQLFQQALLEINRLIYLDETKNNQELYINYLICLRALEMQEEGIFEFETTFPKDVLTNPFLLTEVGNLWLDLENYTKANNYYSLAIDNTNDFENRNKLYLTSSFTEMKLQNFEKATQYYLKISSNSSYYKSAQTNISRNYSGRLS
jgi:putative membrane protein insertion efficiency factor